MLHGDRLVCPWHGACFNAKTGDVEGLCCVLRVDECLLCIDAPALDGLAKYDLSEKDGKVFVKGDERVMKANFPDKLGISCSAKGEEKILVVGG